MKIIEKPMNIIEKPMKIHEAMKPRSSHRAARGALRGPICHRFGIGPGCARGCGAGGGSGTANGRQGPGNFWDPLVGPVGDPGKSWKDADWIRLNDDISWYLQMMKHDEAWKIMKDTIKGYKRWFGTWNSWCDIAYFDVLSILDGWW